MIWKKDKLKPTQPYFVFDTDDFYQEIYLQQGISHFYSFHVTNPREIRVVPDGCIDLFFEYEEDTMSGYACGTPLQFKVEQRLGVHDAFGVRFMPGVQPELIQTTMRELVDKRVPLKEILTEDAGWLTKMAQEKDFYQRIRIFLEAYTKAEKKKEKPFGKNELLLTVKQQVYESDGKVKISELSEITGYSERYINKVFIEKMGFSPKVFCKIIQFQRALEFLNCGTQDKMTDAAVALGYYDQPQFIRDFTRFAGMTPRKYQKMVVEEQYIPRIHSVAYQEREE